MRIRVGVRVRIRVGVWVRGKFWVFLMVLNFRSGIPESRLLVDPLRFITKKYEIS